MRPITAKIDASMWFSRAILGLISVGVLIVSLGRINETVQFANVRMLANRLNNGGSVEAAMVNHYAQEASAMIGRQVCRTDILASGASVVLADMDTHAPGVDYDAWYASLKGAQAFFEFAIKCTPTNGDFWLRLAMIKRAVAEIPQEQRDLLAKSQIFAPSEGDVIIRRLEYYNILRPQSFELVKSQFLQDLWLYLQYANPRESVTLAKSLRAHFRSEFDRMAGTLPASQARRWRRVGIDI